MSSQETLASTDSCTWQLCGDTRASRGSWLLVTEYGAQIDAKDEDGETPLLLALQHRHEGVASFLLSAGADRSVVDKLGLSALHCACRGGLTSFVARLLDEFGAVLHAKTKEGKSCLHMAASQGRLDTAKFLLERGLPVDVLDDHGRSPVFDGLVWGHVEVAELLLDRGADIDRRDEAGSTPICIAMENGRENAVIVLIERGARLDAPPPASFRCDSFDEGLAQALEGGFLNALFTEPDTPIPPYRRVLRWALTSPAVAALAKQRGWPSLEEVMPRAAAAALQFK